MFFLIWSPISLSSWEIQLHATSDLLDNYEPRESANQALKPETKLSIIVFIEETAGSGHSWRSEGDGTNLNADAYKELIDEYCMNNHSLFL